MSPAAATCCATVDPLGPAPTTTVSYKSRDLTVQSVGSFRLACSHGQRAYGNGARATGCADSHLYIIPHSWQSNKPGRVGIFAPSFWGGRCEECPTTNAKIASEWRRLLWLGDDQLLAHLEEVGIVETVGLHDRLGGYAVLPGDGGEGLAGLHDVDDQGAWRSGWCLGGDW